MEKKMAAEGFIGSLGGFGWAVVVAGSILLVLSVLYLAIWRPYKLHAFYRSMHLKGPSYRPLVGNLPEIWTLQLQVLGMKSDTADPADLAARCLPHLTYWSKLYGKMFTYSESAKVNLCVLDTEIIREILVHKADCYRRSPSARLWLNSHGACRHRKEVIDTSRIHDDPEHWTTLRRIWGPMSDKDQGCVRTVVKISNTLVRKWANYLQEAADGAGRLQVDAGRDINKISMEMLLSNLLGSTVSTEQLEALYLSLGGEEQEDEEPVTTATDLLKAHVSRIRSRGRCCVSRLLTETIEARLKSRSHQWEPQGDGETKRRDLLDLMISISGRRSTTQNVQKLVADCQMLIAAQKATSQLIAQTLQLLARHTDWQIQARAEILDNRPLDSPENEDGQTVSSCYPNLAKLKTMNMILNESLRLYPPILSTEKLCRKRHRLGKYTVLPGTFVQIPIVLVHHSRDLWGKDAHLFRPDRFADGAVVSRPFALLPFSAGPSVCLGYNLALQEAKIVIASILTSISISLEPEHLATASSKCKFLVIRKLKGDDFAIAAKHRSTRRQISVGC